MRRLDWPAFAAGFCVCLIVGGAVLMVGSWSRTAHFRALEDAVARERAEAEAVKRAAAESLEDAARVTTAAQAEAARARGEADDLRRQVEQLHYAARLQQAAQAWPAGTPSTKP
jgi:hypothetical protein